MVEGSGRRSLGARLEGPPLHGRRRVGHRADDHPPRSDAATPVAPPSDRGWAPADRAERRRARRATRSARSPGAAPSSGARCRALRAHAAPGRRPGHATRSGAIVTAGTELVPRPTPSIVGAIGPHRRWASAHADLADVKAIKDAFGGTVNDVVLAVDRRRLPRPAAVPVRGPRPRIVCARWCRCPCVPPDDLRAEQPGGGDGRRAPDRHRRSRRPPRRDARPDGAVEALRTRSRRRRALTALAELTPPSLLAVGLRT